MDGDNLNHPNHPDNAPLADLVSGEADAILAECVDLTTSIKFAVDWEALMEDRAYLIWRTAMALADHEHDEQTRLAWLGRTLIEVVRSAAEKRAAYSLEIRKVAA